jgi:hypothetical protein
MDALKSNVSNHYEKNKYFLPLPLLSLVEMDLSSKAKPYGCKSLYKKEMSALKDLTAHL